MIAELYKHNQGQSLGWGHSGKEYVVGNAKFLSPRVIAEGNGYDELATLRQTVVVSRNLPAHLAAEAITHTLMAAYNRCTHEHDCCGCRCASLTITKTRRSRTYSVRIRQYRNL